jgi:hypothetical protein
MELSRYKSFVIGNIYSMLFLKASYLGEALFKTFEIVYTSQARWGLYVDKVSGQISEVWLRYESGVL